MFRTMRRSIAVLLHNIRSAHNVGSIFRTADAAGVSSVYLTGYTPTPRDRFGRAQKDIAKTALGAERIVPWEYAASPGALIATLKREGWHIVGVEQDARAREYGALAPRAKTTFVFGNEVRGLSKPLREKCDALIEIPMRGAMVRHAHHPRRTRRGKESLNVSVAAGIVLFHALRRIG
ncbi:RNA methyltransferase [Candidatus Kaiserbacteria bacterium CG10_big_fil_rev_8_21_14_0_10_59_10]|uniref:RNA methyltransferase n=1 Tax=Candidatus Kaiserbacteria bacterium CG10_big_fil_rev_8_21_14_0_10_59_10 TaxID=1974612 RepID=A0A2H0U838_9BACT|nr:MAG: RNA methyltransferase [Candidatus Kaiserbacteria bacterium CG10_big_fil_rev_8_21_14_0_10_59_10]